jgi:hypothetical protein
MTDFRALCAELVEAYEWCINRYMTAPFNKDALVYRTRTALAQPEPQEVTDEEIAADFRGWYNERYYCSYFGGIMLVECIEWTRYALARYTRPAIEPVPVSERLPGPEDCDAEGRCWLWERMDDRWVLMDRELAQQDWPWHWLPHYALPVPQQEVK